MEPKSQREDAQVLQRDQQERPPFRQAQVPEVADGRRGEDRDRVRERGQVRRAPGPQRRSPSLPRARDPVGEDHQGWSPVPDLRRRLELNRRRAPGRDHRSHPESGRDR